MSKLVYFKCVPMKATLSTKCCEERQSHVQKTIKVSTHLDIIYKKCIECSKSKAYKEYQKDKVPNETIEKINEHYQPKFESSKVENPAAKYAADTFHPNNEAIYNRSYNPFLNHTQT